ncbi:MAG: four helix bundle protein [Pirellulales bacterium]
MNSESHGAAELIDRVKKFALRVIRLYSVLPSTPLHQTLGKQAFRSSTSAGAHCREARRSRSTAEFVSKLQVALQELDETAYWLELIVESEILPLERVADLRQENDELIAILTSIVKREKIR